MRVTTLETIAGHTIEETLGAVRGTAIWSRRISKNSTAGHRALEHMTVSDVANGLAQVREDAEAILMRNAKALGANAVVGLKIDLVELGNDMYQAFASGTAARIAAIEAVAPAIPAPAFASPFGYAANDFHAVVLPFQRRASVAN